MTASNPSARPKTREEWAAWAIEHPRAPAPPIWEMCRHGYVTMGAECEECIEERRNYLGKEWML